MTKPEVSLGLNFSMNRILFINIAFLFLLNTVSCRQRVNHVYIISKEDSIRKTAYTRPDGIVIMPPKVKYSRYTFILDPSQNLYFYSLPESISSKGTYDEPEPDSINLQPESLIFIPKGTEETFFKENVLDQKSNDKIKTVCIAAYSDTLKGDFIQYLTSTGNDKTKNISLNIRLAHSEEREAMKYRLSRKN